MFFYVFWTLGSTKIKCPYDFFWFDQQFFLNSFHSFPEINLMLLSFILKNFASIELIWDLIGYIKIIKIVQADQARIEQ